MLDKRIDEFFKEIDRNYPERNFWCLVVAIGVIVSMLHLDTGAGGFTLLFGVSIIVLYLFRYSQNSGEMLINVIRYLPISLLGLHLYRLRKTVKIMGINFLIQLVLIAFVHHFYNDGSKTMLEMLTVPFLILFIGGIGLGEVYNLILTWIEVDKKRNR